MMYKKIAFLIMVIFIIGTTPAVSVPAAPIIHTLEQNDGNKFTARLWGDERSHGWESTDDYSILFDEKTKEWKYAITDADGKFVPSTKVIGIDAPPSNISKHLRPSGNVQSKILGLKAPKAPSLPDKVVSPGGTANIPVLLINFNDKATSYTPANFDTLLFGNGVNSMKDYYEEVSYGFFSVSSGPNGVVGWFTASQNHDYYGINDGGGSDTWPGTLVREAVAAADASFNFAPYDQNSDCYVDVVNIIHQGSGEEAGGPSTDIWSHRWNLYSAYYFGYSDGGIYTTNDPCSAGGFIKVDDYVIQPETLWGNQHTMGVFAHEYGHALGLPDLYDTDYSSGGIGDWGLMSGGSWNGVPQGSSPSHLMGWSKYYLGWVNPTIVNVSSPLFNEVIDNVEMNDDVYVLPVNLGEYFLIENRQQTEFDTYLPGNGILIWHIDESMGSNSLDSHRLVDLEEADGVESTYGDSGDPWKLSSAGFTNTSTPNSNYYNGTESDVRVVGISGSSDNMTADLTIGIVDIISSPPAPVNLANTTGNYWVNHTWEAGSGNVTDGYNISIDGEWYNSTQMYYNNSVGAGNWSNITVYAYNASGIGSLSLPISQNTQAPSAPIPEYIPPTPTNLANTTGNYWANHTWSAGLGNVTDGYNVSINGEWYNSTQTYYYNNVGPGNWSNITVYAYNASGIGSLSSSASQNTQAPAAESGIITVDDSGGADYMSIQAAVDNASVGDTIYVYNGSYLENVNVNKQVTLQGEGADVVTVSAALTSDHVFEVTADYVNISGFKVTGATNSPGAGIYLGSGVHHANISDNSASNNDYGIYLFFSSNNTLSNNTVSDNDYGIYLSSSSNNTFISNNVSDNNYWENWGITLSSSNNNTLIDNNISKNYYGIRFSASSNNTFSNNIVSFNNHKGVYLSSSSNNTLIDNIFIEDGLDVYQSYKNNITNNTVNGRTLAYFEDKSDLIIRNVNAGQVILVNSSNITVESINVSNTRYGITLWNTNNCMINNTILDNSDYGIYLVSSSNNTLIDNTVSNNDYGIYLVSSNNNTLNNNTASNTVMGMWLSSSSNNTLNNNTASNNSIRGMWLDSSSNNTLNNNTASNNSIRGMRLDSSSNNTLNNNTADGIYLVSSSNNTLSNNFVSNNSEGIGLDSSSYNNLMDNNVTNNSNGIGLHSISDNNNLTNNNISNNYRGIFFTGASSNGIIDNHIFSNNYGIYLDEWGTESSENTIKGNIIELNNNGGIVLYWGNNEIDNNFFNNYVNTNLMFQNLWNITKTLGVNIVGGPYLGGNFWANPSGTGFSQTCADTNKDWICDSTYSFSGNIDYWPLAATSSGYGYISGAILNNSTGIPGAVVIADTGVSTIADGTGFYSLLLEAGTYTLNATSDPVYYSNSSVVVNVVSGSTVVQDINLMKKPTGTISGNVAKSS